MHMSQETPAGDLSIPVRTVTKLIITLLGAPNKIVSHALVEQTLVWLSHFLINRLQVMKREGFNIIMYVYNGYN